MGPEDILAGWERSIPTNEKVRNVLAVLTHFFQDVKWKEGSHIVITDDNLSFYEREINRMGTKIAVDGSFHIPTVKGRFVKKYNIKKILHMVEILELCKGSRK